jgi:hypothetical protein
MTTILSKFAVGRIFAQPTTNPNVAHALPNTPNGFRTVIDPPVHLGHSQTKFRVQDRVSGFNAGASGDAHRNFLWLPYIPGYVSEIAQGNLPVITGPLSGCPTTRYLRGGQWYVGHPGTVDDHNHAQSIAARGYWNAYAATLPPHQRAGCNVLQDMLAMNLLGTRAVTVAGDNLMKCWAIVMPNGDFYGMAAYYQSDNPNRARPIPMPQAGVVGNDVWWRVAIAPFHIQTTVFPANGQM